MTDIELLSLNRQGFIPGPFESEEDFSRRVESIKKNFEEKNEIPPAHWDWVRFYLKEIFDFEPECLPAFYSNQGLRPWQGAATWIEGKNLSFVQLRKALKKGSYLFFYRREEILAHEAVHAARSGFDEPKNEEFFAYMTSEKRWHKVLGPIVSRPWEIWPLFLCTILGVFSHLGYLAAAFWIGLGFARLIRQHRRLAKAFQQILKTVLDKKIARAILFRLTDSEILMFSKGEKIEDYGNNQKCLRWRLICLAYLKK